MATKKKTETLATPIRFEYDVYSNYSYRSPEEYGSWEENNSFSMGEKFWIPKAKNNYHLLVPFVPEAGKDYFVVYCVYSSGDSFGSEFGKYEFLAFFDSEEKASDLIRVLLEETKKEEYKYSVEHDGVVYYLPWVGYFESLEELTYRKVQMKEAE